MLCLTMICFGMIFIIVDELVMGVVVINIVDIVIVFATHSVVWF